MSQSLCVSLTRSYDDPERATMGFMVANAALAAGSAVMVFLSIEGVRLALAGEAERIRLEGMPALGELVESFVKGGGQLIACGTCFNRRGLKETALRPGAAIAGAATLTQYLAGGAPCVSL
jgi:uncharacterized protein